MGDTVVQKREAEQCVDSIVILSFISKNYQEVDRHTHIHSLTLGSKAVCSLRVLTLEADGLNENCDSTYSLCL